MGSEREGKRRGGKGFRSCRCGKRKGGGAYARGQRGATRRVTSQGDGELGVASEDDGDGARRMPSTQVESQRAVKSEQTER